MIKFKSLFTTIYLMKNLLLFYNLDDITLKSKPLSICNYWKIPTSHTSLIKIINIKLMLVVLTLAFMPMVSESFAAVSISWDKDERLLSNGGIGVFGIQKEVIITVIDDEFKNNGVLDENRKITIVSDGDGDPTSIKLELKETNPDSGEFKNTNLVFMPKDYQFSKNASITIELDKSKDENNNPSVHVLDNVQKTFEGVAVRSSSNPTGIIIELEETEPDSGFFKGKVTFGDVNDPSTNTIKVKEGDVVTFGESGRDAKDDTILSNGIVVGSNDKTIGAIQAAKNDQTIVTVTAFYTNNDGVSFDDDISVNFDGQRGPGGAGGGAIRPGLVVDSSGSGGTTGGGGGPTLSSAESGSGCSSDCIPPTLGVDQDNRRLVADGFSFNDNPVDAKLYYTPYPLITVNVGEENKAVLKIYDNEGPENIKHVGFGFGMGKGESFADSRARINLDIDHTGRESVSLHDPENVLDNVRVVTQQVSCTDNLTSPLCLQVTFFHTFREQLEFNMVGTYVWDFKQNSWQNYFNHGIHIEGDSLNPPKTTRIYVGTGPDSGYYNLVQIDKFEDTWADKHGNIYQYKGNDRYDKIYTVPKPMVYDKVTSHGCDRNCNWFDKYLLYEELRAKQKLSEMTNGKPIYGYDLDEPETIFFHIVPRSEDARLQAAIEGEIIRAEQLFDVLFDFKINH